MVDSYEDSPADKAGIKSGDYITKVDGKDITSMNLNAAVALIKGEKGTYVELEVVSGNEVKNVKVKRDEIKVKTVEYELLEGNMGYIYVTEFDSVTLKQFNDALDDLKSQGMESLIIDVRSNPGGELDTVVKCLTVYYRMVLLCIHRISREIRKDMRVMTGESLIFLWLYS